MPGFLQYWDLEERGDMREEEVDEEQEKEENSVSEDEGIIWALRSCPSGEFVRLHEKICKIGQKPHDCTCSPLLLKPGAMA